MMRNDPGIIVIVTIALVLLVLAFALLWEFM
jgi:hypothetical protein